MGVIVRWYDEEKTAIHQIYEGRWSWDELHTATEDLKDMLDTVHHKVDFIIDVQAASLLPSGAASQFKHIRAVFEHPQAGRPIIVGANRLIQMFVDIFMKVSPDLNLDFKYVSTLEEARTVASADS